MNIRIATTAFIFVFSAVTIAEGMNKEATTPAAQLQEDFFVLDQDGNGKLSQNELNASPELAAEFVEIDINENADIDLTEFVIYKSEATAAGASGKLYEEQ